jgi:hypothetical protein
MFYEVMLSPAPFHILQCDVLPCPIQQILAPSNEAFDTLLRALGGGKKLPKEQLYKLPELKEILQYHIIPGHFTTGAHMCGVSYHLSGQGISDRSHLHTCLPFTSQNRSDCFCPCMHR